MPPVGASRHQVENVRRHPENGPHPQEHHRQAEHGFQLSRRGLLGAGLLGAGAVLLPRQPATAAAQTSGGR